jgi:hypothetical protein
VGTGIVRLGNLSVVAGVVTDFIAGPVFIIGGCVKVGTLLRAASILTLASASPFALLWIGVCEYLFWFGFLLGALLLMCSADCSDIVFMM